MSQRNSIFEVQLFIEASTPQLLVEAQLKNNIKFGKKFHYTVMKNGNNWIAWYEHDVKQERVKFKEDNE